MEIPKMLVEDIKQFIETLRLNVDKETFVKRTELYRSLLNNYNYKIEDIATIMRELKPISPDDYNLDYYALALAHAKSQRKETLETKEAVINYLESMGIIIEITSDNKTNQELIEKIKTHFSVPYFRQKYVFQLERQKPSFEIKDIENFMKLARNNYINLNRGQNIFALFGEIATRHKMFG